MSFLPPIFKGKSWLLVALIAVFIQIGTYAIFEMNAPDSLRIRTEILKALSDQAITPVATLREYRGRIFWEGSCLLLVWGYILSMIWSIGTLNRCHQTSSIRPVLLAGLAIVMLDLLRLRSVDEHSAIYNNIFATTFDWVSASSLIGPSVAESVWIAIISINLLAVLSGIMLLLAICAAVTEPRRDVDNALDFYLMRDHCLDQSVIIGSLIMLFGMLHMGCWLEWPISILDDSETKKSILGVMSSIYQFWGIAFSVQLLTVYGSATLYWNRRMHEFIAHDQPEVNTKEWLREHGFEFSIRHHAPQFIAIVAPIIAGFSGGGSNLFGSN